MTDKSLSVDNKVHELRFGDSFEQKSKVAFHSMRCKSRFTPCFLFHHLTYLEDGVRI